MVVCVEEATKIWLLSCGRQKQTIQTAKSFLTFAKFQKPLTSLLALCKILFIY